MSGGSFDYLYHKLDDEPFDPKVERELTAERDAARRDLNAIFELTITDVMASYDPEQIVHHVSILRKERDAALAKLESEGRE